MTPCADFILQGKHHLHLMDPNSVLPHIARFLSEEKERFPVYDDS